MKLGSKAKVDYLERRRGDRASTDSRGVGKYRCAAALAAKTIFIICDSIVAPFAKSIGTVRPKPMGAEVPC